MTRASLEEIFSTCDVISIHTAWNSQTEGMINKELISMMKDNAVLVNTELPTELIAPYRDAGSEPVVVDTNEITRPAGKKVLSAVFESDADVDKYCEENGLNVKVDESLILTTVQRIVAENPDAVANYKSGKTKAMQALFGLIMRELKGTGDPVVIRTLLEQELNK